MTEHAGGTAKFQRLRGLFLQFDDHRRGTGDADLQRVLIYRHFLCVQQLQRVCEEAVFIFRTEQAGQSFRKVFFLRGGVDDGQNHVILVRAEYEEAVVLLRNAEEAAAQHRVGAVDQTEHPIVVEDVAILAAPWVSAPVVRVFAALEAGFIAVVDAWHARHHVLQGREHFQTGAGQLVGGAIQRERGAGRKEGSSFLR